MFMITTTLRSFLVEAPTVSDAVESAFVLILDGEEITDILFEGPFPYLITEIAA